MNKIYRDKKLKDSICLSLAETPYRLLEASALMELSAPCKLFEPLLLAILTLLADYALLRLLRLYGVSGL